MIKFFAITGVIFFFIVLYAVILAAFAFLFHWAWNLVVPPAFHGPILSYGQSFAVVILISIITGGFKMSRK